MRKISPQPLTTENFAPFGDVIDTTTASNHFTINYGLTTRFHDLAHIDVNAHGGRPGFSIFRGQPISLPHRPEVMEYHPLGSQLFYPVCYSPFLVLVAPPSETLDTSQIQLFITNGKQGVNYHKGTWHHYLMTLDKESDFIVIDRIADDKNCIETTISEPIIIQLDETGSKTP